MFICIIIKSFDNLMVNEPVQTYLISDAGKRAKSYTYGKESKSLKIGDLMSFSQLHLSSFLILDVGVRITCFKMG